MSDNPYRQIPSVTTLLGHPTLAAMRLQVSPAVLVESIRIELDRTRAAVADFNFDDLLVKIANRVAASLRPGYPSVINATGVVLHTNLGRAPMAESAARAAYDAARGYLALELDLASGQRSSRQGPVRAALCRLTGAESATVVNNCAAATVVVLRALAAGREVVVSRGQLIEIGGSFRIPEILAASGATLREVGTTNITRLTDYEAAIGPATAALMRIHTSNFRVQGFTEAVEIEALAALGVRRGVPVIDDVGSGAAIPFEGEPGIRNGLAAGADLVIFSGDKLLGGPQCGIIAGRAKWITTIEHDPLMRAFRCDKMTLAALDATLKLYDGDPQQTVPSLRMLAMTLKETQSRCEAFAERLLSVRGFSMELQVDESCAGGGAMPEASLPSVVMVLRFERLSAEEAAARLRTGTPAVVARVKNDSVIIDLRTVFPHQEADLLAGIMNLGLQSETSVPMEAAADNN